MTDTMRRAMDAHGAEPACERCQDSDARELVSGQSPACRNRHCLACRELALAAAFRVALAEPPGGSLDELSMASMRAQRDISDGKSFGGVGWYVASRIMAALREALGLETP